MAGANRLQVRFRGIAAVTALAFALCGVLAMRHEAGTAHVRDRAGAYLHAPALTGHHARGDSDIHGQRSADGDAGECALLTAFHQAASAPSAPPAVTAVVLTRRAPRASYRHAVDPRREVYRLAPKTSPPARV